MRLKHIRCPINKKQLWSVPELYRAGGENMTRLDELELMKTGADTNIKELCRAILENRTTSHRAAQLKMELEVYLSIEREIAKEKSEK